MIIGSYHKTSSLLFSNIWNYYFKKKCKNFNHFDRVSDNMIKNTKCVVIIRHPCEIIMSGVRRHQITEENGVIKGKVVTMV